jgi:arabinosyltransferase C
VSADRALGADSANGFSPNGIPPDIAADPVAEPPASGNFIDAADNDGTEVGVADQATGVGINGSKARLPYGLDPDRTPVLGSWRSGAQQQGQLRSAWYRLPSRGGADGRVGPLLVISAAGRFPAGAVAVQWATDRQVADGEVGGSLDLADIGPPPSWRNLRVPLAAIPADATAVRVVAEDDDLAPQQWIAVTPPRVPQLRTLQLVVGSQDPVLLDWVVGMAFPCQRPFGHALGVTEVPKWRILPDRLSADANSPVMDTIGGGPLGISELLFQATTMPSYLRDDWSRDWGALQRLTPFYPNATPADLGVGTATRSGLWRPAGG